MNHNKALYQNFYNGNGDSREIYSPVCLSYERQLGKKKYIWFLI